METTTLRMQQQKQHPKQLLKRPQLRKVFLQATRCVTFWDYGRMEESHFGQMGPLTFQIYQRIHMLAMQQEAMKNCA